MRPIPLHDMAYKKEWKFERDLLARVLRHSSTQIERMEYWRQTKFFRGMARTMGKNAAETVERAALKVLQS